MSASAPGYLFVAAELQDALRSPIQGWFGQREQFAMERDYDPVPGIARFLAGTPPILQLAAVEEGARLTGEAGLDAIRAKSLGLTGLIVAVGVALAQFWPNWIPLVIIIGIFLVGQLLEGYVLAPKLVGKRIGLHPVWLMFALFAFGYLFGFVGLLVAVPLAAAIGVLVRFALRRYLASPLYGGESS